MPNYLDETGLSRYDGKIKEMVSTGLGGKLSVSLKGAANGLAELDANGKVPSAQLPSYVDEVIEGYYNTTDGKFYEESTYITEITGETGKIYVDLTSNNAYRWSGSVFVEISESLALGETSSTAYAGDKGKANADHIGTMSSLTTTDKTSLVGAVNEVKSTTYTKTEVDNLLNEVDNSITALVETSPATAAHEEDTFLTYNHVIYSVIDDIAIGDTLTIGTNIELATIPEGTVVYSDDDQGGSGGGGGHIIVNPSGTEMAQESKLQFGEGFTVTDDPTNGITKVEIASAPVADNIPVNPSDTSGMNIWLETE